MGAEHAVGRARTGAPTSAVAPRTPGGGAGTWPRTEATSPVASRPAVASSGAASPAPSPAPAPAPAPSGATPLVARRRPRLPLSVLLVVLGVALVVVGALLLGTRAGAGLLAVQLLVCAVARAVRPAPGPNALAVRSRALDVLTLAGFAVVLGVLAAIVPGAR